MDHEEMEENHPLESMSRYEQELLNRVLIREQERGERAEIMKKILGHAVSAAVGIGAYIIFQTIMK